MITDKQREERQGGIFSSDVPRIMAGDSVRVALEKMGEIPRENLDGIPQIQLGNLIEPRILDAYEAEYGPLSARSPDTMRHAQHKWLGAHLDGLTPKLVVECKSVGWYNRAEWGDGGDEVPDRVLWQVQEQCAVVGLPLAHVPVCFLTEEALVAFATGRPLPISVFVVPADRDLEAYIVERCGKVWQHVQDRTLPDPEKPADVRLLYRKDTGAVIEADEAVVEDYKQLVSAKAALATAEKAEDEAKAKLQAFMKDASEIRYRGRTLATWKKEKDRAAYSVDARPGARKFLIKEIAL
jgi:hypothetical protein